MFLARIVLRVKKYREDVRCYVQMENAGEALIGNCYGFEDETRCSTCRYYIKQEEITYGNQRFTRSESSQSFGGN